MARKKFEPITSLGNEDKLTVQKSLPLFNLWRSELSLAEFKILDIYLSRIDSHKPDRRAVMFEKGELEKILGVKKLNNQDLQERLKHLMGNVVEVPDDTVKKGFRLITLFEEAVAEQDDNGLWQVSLECTQKAMKYFFNVENLGYLRYKLRCITSITSRYTYIMFIFLESNRFRKSWEVPLEELKAILNCDKEEYAKEFKYFNRDVLKKVQKELNEKTECRYTYEPVKKGRTVVAIKFTLETQAAFVPSAKPEQLEIDDLPSPNDPIYFYLEAAPCFTHTEMEQLLSLLVAVPEIKLPQMGDVEMNRWHYLQAKYKSMCVQDERKPIKHKLSYMIAMIQKDITSL